MIPNWNDLEEKLSEAFPDRAVSEEGPHMRHVVDQALATWKARIAELGIDIFDESQLFAFVAGLCEFESYLDEVLIEARFQTDVAKDGERRILRRALGNVLGTLRPYIEAHVPPGSVGSGYTGS